MAKTRTEKQSERLTRLASIHGALGMCSFIFSLTAGIGLIVTGIAGGTWLSGVIKNAEAELEESAADLINVAAAFVGMYFVVCGFILIAAALIRFLHNKTVCAVLTSLDCIMENMPEKPKK